MYNGWFYRIRSLIPAVHKRTLYFAFVHSRLVYGLLLYGCATASALQHLQIAQNRCLRTLQTQPMETPRATLYDNYNTMSIKHMHKLEWLKVIHTSIHNGNRLPQTIKQLFIFNNPHDYNTRSISNNVLFRYNACSKNNYCFNAVTLYNNLPQNIRTCTNYHTFVKLCVTFIRNI